MKLDPTLLAPVLALAAALGLDWAAGIAVAAKAGVFRWEKLPQILETTLTPYLGPPALLAILGAVSDAQHAGTTAPITAAVMALCASYSPRFLMDAKQKLAAFESGTLVPQEAH